MPQTLKFSQFYAGGELTANDIVVGLRNIDGQLTNTQFTWTGLPGGNVTAEHADNVASIALWTGADFVITDSGVNIVGNEIVPIAPLDRIYFGGESLGVPAGTTGTRPVDAAAGDIRYNTTTNVFENYNGAAWLEWAIATGQPQAANSIATWNGTRNEIQPTDLSIVGDEISALTVGNQVTIGGTGALGVPIGTTAERPVAPANGYVRYNTDLNNEEFYINGAWVELGGGGGNGTPVIETVTQPGNSFVGGEWVKIQGGIYVVAQADTPFDAEVIGVVTAIIAAGDTFLLQQSGYIPSFPGATTADTVYFLSPDVAGTMTATVPFVNGQVNRPVFVAKSTANPGSGWVVPYRGMIVGSGAPINPGTGIIQIPIHQDDHGFTVGQVLYYNGTEYALAQANSTTTSEVVGMVEFVIDDNNFNLQEIGFINALPAPVSPLVPGTTYYLSTTVAGGLQAAEPVTVGAVSRPVIIATGTTSGWLTTNRQNVIGTEDVPTVAIVVTQDGHGFTQGQIVAITAVADTYALALASSMTNAYLTAGMVAAVIDVNNFILQQSGWVTGLTELVPPTPTPVPGTVYFLSPTTPGLMTATEPVGVAAVSRPVFQGVDSTSGWILPQRPILNSTGIPAGAGAILQVGSAFFNTITTINSVGTLTWQVVPQMTVTITPTYINSRFLITMTISAGAFFGNSTYNFCQIAVGRNGTPVGLGAAGYPPSGISSTGVIAPGSSSGTDYAISYIDTPNTLSPIVYSLLLNMAVASGRITFNQVVGNAGNYNVTSFITVMEIAP